MSVRNWASKEITNLRGMWSALAGQRKGTPTRASYAANVRINPGALDSRPGTSAVLAASAQVTGIHNWISPSANLVILNSGGDVIRYEQSTDASTTLKSLGAGYYQSVADLDTRLFIAGYSSNGGGVECFVHDGEVDPSVHMDSAFGLPLTGITSATATDGGAGLCTAGTHYLGIVFQNRTGFKTYPCPISAVSQFIPVSCTLSASGRTISFALEINTPTDAGGNSALYVIMTRADNPNKYFWVPDVETSIPAETTGWTHTFSISISDEDLAQADSADDQFDVVAHRSIIGADKIPFKVPFVTAYGGRMVYGVSDPYNAALKAGTIMVSEIDDAQFVTFDRNNLAMPNGRAIAYAFTVGTTTDLYLTGDKWTARVTDNGDYPSTWARPVMISDSLGAPFPNCVCNRTAGNYAWVASEVGLFRFDGAYTPLPITYLCSDIWKRINWTAAYAIKVEDDVPAAKVYVSLPLDAATTCTHLLVVDYTRGMDYDSCDITVDTFPANFSSIGMVKESATDRSVLWIGPAAAGNIVHFDPTTHNDEGVAIDCIWESGLIRSPNEMESHYIRFGNLHTWVRGSGDMAVRVFGQDRATGVAPADLVLQANPSVDQFSKFNLNPVRNYTVRYFTNAIDAWFSLSGFTPYFRPSVYRATASGGSATWGTIVFPDIATGATFTWGDAAPTTGTYVQTSMVLKLHPVAGGNIGWTCVTGGSPGTWKAWGQISE